MCVPIKSLIYKYFYAKSDILISNKVCISEIFLPVWAWYCAAVLSTWKAGAGEAGVQGHRQLCESKAILRYIDHISAKNK